MQKLKIIIVLFILMLLSSCSFVAEVNDSIDYVNAATDHIDKLNTFAEDAPPLIQEAVTNPEVREELETQLTTLKQDIEQFIDLQDIPSIAEDIHQEFVSKNEVLLDEINKVLGNGQLAIDQLENSQLMTTISEITRLLDSIENLGQ